MPSKGARSKRNATAKDEPQGKILEHFAGCSYVPGSRKDEQGKEGAKKAETAEPVVIKDSHDALPPRVSTDERSQLRAAEPPTHRRGCRASRERGGHHHHAAVAQVVGVALITIALLVGRGTEGARGVAPRAPAGPDTVMSSLSTRLAEAPDPRSVLAAVAEAQLQQEGGLGGRGVCAVFKTLAKLERRFRCRDASGAPVLGLNATVLLYHKPFSSQRAELVRAATAAAPRLSSARAVRLLHHVCALAPAGFAGGPLCTALALRVMDTSHALSAESTAMALQASGRLGVCNDWLINSLASQGLKTQILRAFEATIFKKCFYTGSSYGNILGL